MHGIPDAGSTDGSPEPPLDWPAPGTPLAGEEPTIELPAVTEAVLAEDVPTSAPTLAAAALSLALAKPAGTDLALAKPAGTDLALAEPAGADRAPATAAPARSANAKSANARSGWARRVPALERRGPRPARSASARAHTVVGLDDLLDDRPVDDWPVDDRPLEDWPLNDRTVDDWPLNDLADDRPEPAGEPDDPDARTYRTDRTDRSEEPEPGAPPPAEPGRRWLVGAAIAAAALLLTGTTVVLLTRGGEPSDAAPAGWNPPIAAAVAPSSHTATAPLDGRTSAGFDLVDGAKRVTVRAADLGDTLYRITTPEADAAVPRAEERDGRIRLRLDGGAQAVDITLNAAVLWDLRVTGGADSSTIDLSAGRVGGVDLTGGASRIALTLPRPDGTLSVRMSGGVRDFDVRAAEQTPVRVRVGSGAGQITLDGQQHAGVSAGQTFTPASWEAAVDRIDVDAAGGMSAMTVAPY